MCPTYESQSVMQVRVVELDRNVVNPRLDSIGPPFSCPRKSVGIPFFRNADIRIIVDLKTREPPARSLLNRADHELPSL